VVELTVRGEARFEAMMETAGKSIKQEGSTIDLVSYFKTIRQRIYKYIEGNRR
jgi:hypothetical protein